MAKEDILDGTRDTFECPTDKEGTWYYSKHQKGEEVKRTARSANRKNRHKSLLDSHSCVVVVVDGAAVVPGSFERNLEAAAVAVAVVAPYLVFSSLLLFPPKAAPSQRPFFFVFLPYRRRRSRGKNRPNQKRTLNKLSTELQCRNLVKRCQLGMHKLASSMQ